MKKKEIFNNLAIAAALGLIFGVALHNWGYGLIIGMHGYLW